MAQPSPSAPPRGFSVRQSDERGSQLVQPAASTPAHAVDDPGGARRRGPQRRRRGLARLFGGGREEHRARGQAPEASPGPPQDLLPAALASLALRDLTLVESLLRLVEEMEAREEDPDLLESLFRIDHLATRMRRNGENLLVLAGQETDTQRHEPSRLLDVVRAGISEITDYYRAEVSTLPEMRVAGLAADDVSHLLAELLDNATSRSPQHQQVVVGGRALDDGTVVLAVEDNGIGIPAERLVELNARLGAPPVLDVSVTRHMGLYVVGRLAHRHGIRVHLDSRPFGGTAAYVLLPPWLVQQDATSQMGHNGRQAPLPGRPAAPHPGVPGRPAPGAARPGGAAPAPSGPPPGPADAQPGASPAAPAGGA
ncbi:MAG: sensor histidine kinase, partial [Actinomycetes bacterium]